MEYSTAELCDIYLDQIDVVEPVFSSFGGITSFCGPITTVKCFESNGLLHSLVKNPSDHGILLVDGGGSLRRALIDADLAIQAQENGWAGIICYGAVRDVDELAELDIGVQALASIPIGADTTEQGESDIPVNFCGVSFLPDDYVYADNNGIILSPEALEPPEVDEDADAEAEVY